jgi:hypothetical protein
MIKTIKKEELDKKCLHLIGKTLVELGQPNKTEEEKLHLALSLSRDLERRYSKMSWEAVIIAFEDGVRDTDKFLLCPQTWCKWLTKMKHKIWEGWYNEKNNNKHLIAPQLKELLINQKLLNN